MYLGHFLVFKAGYRDRKEPNHSYMESPWIEESLKYCTLSFSLMSKYLVVVVI